MLIIFLFSVANIPATAGMEDARKGRHGAEARAAGHTDECQDQFLPFPLVRIPPHGMTHPMFREGLPTSIM